MSSSWSILLTILLLHIFDAVKSNLYCKKVQLHWNIALYNKTHNRKSWILIFSMSELWTKSCELYHMVHWLSVESDVILAGNKSTPEMIFGVVSNWLFWKNGTSPTTRMGQFRTKNDCGIYKLFLSHQYWSWVCERFHVPFSLKFGPRSNVRLDSFDRSILLRTVQSPDRPRPPVWFGFISLKISIFSHLLL